MKASAISIDRNISLLFKGPWGHSKTVSAASFALDGPVYLAYWDKKKPIELVNYFSRFGEKGKKILDNIEFDVYGANNANEYLKKLIDLEKDCRYFAVITDSLTNLTAGAVNWSLSFRDDRKNKDKLKVIPDWDEYKVETSLVTQALDICRILPCNVIWTAHPVQSVKIEGSGSTQKVSKVIKLVSYGAKTGDIAPGNFSEIYHFSKQTSYDSGASRTKYIVDTDAVGDDFAKSNLGLVGEFDITDKLFYEVWKELATIKQKEINNALSEMNQPKPVNPFASPQVLEVFEQKKWNPTKGEYE